jgi:hypothetical protein
MNSVASTLGLLAFSALALAACSGAPHAGDSLMCDGASRVVLDCSSEIAYQGVKADGTVSVLNLGSAGGKLEDKAIRKVNDGLASFVAAQTRLCRDYNACVLGKEQYTAEAKRTRDIFQAASQGAQAFAIATSSADKDRVLSKLYESVVPEADRPEALAIRFSLDAELPASVGGGQTFLKPGAPLPTKSRVAFGFWASKSANLYVFQTTQSGSVKVLFPDPRIGTSNPIAAATAVNVPSGGRRFVLNGEDLGSETVYLAASVKPLANLDAALQKVASGQVAAIGGDRVLSGFTTVNAGKAPDDCQTRSFDLEPASGTPCPTRGLDLEGDDAARGDSSLAAKTSPGDDVIVKAFTFAHVTEEDYPAAMARYRSAAR